MAFIVPTEILELQEKIREFINKEVESLKSEIDRISKTTQWNGVSVLGGEDSKEFSFQVGTGSSEDKDQIKFDTKQYNIATGSIGIDDVNTLSKESAQSNLEKLDSAIQSVNSFRASIGAIQNRLQSTINNLMVSHENLSAANSRIRDADVAAETAELTKRNILVQAGTATLAQANQTSQLALRLL